MRCFFIALMLLCYSCTAREASSCPKILNYIQNQLPQYGVLKDSAGFVYVDVDNEYICKLVTFIQKDGFEEPPYFGNPDLVGAHITVIYPDEVKRYGIGKIQECGETIYFTPKECKVVYPPKWQEIDEVYLVVVKAPEFDRIRKKYGLPKREYEFHITIGVKPKVAQSA
jgi:hypothetical protein